MPIFPLFPLEDGSISKPDNVLLCWIWYSVTRLICFCFVVTAETFMPSYTTTQTNSETARPRSDLVTDIILKCYFMIIYGS